MISRIGIRGATASIAAALLLCAAAMMAVAQAQMPPAGMARVWFLRELEPGMATHAPPIFSNTQPIGIAAQGDAFYRDVPPGTYEFEVQNCVEEPNSAYRAALEPGMVIGIEVTVAVDYAPLGCSPRDAYYLRLVPPQSLAGYLAHLVNLGAR
ncbi:MAG TPA: hypothetical protein VND87_15430 [Stellaceae bacterium]|nr:hypothetical protein [Stellaceae bacterium]